MTSSIDLPHHNHSNKHTQNFEAQNVNNLLTNEGRIIVLRVLAILLLSQLALASFSTLYMMIINAQDLYTINRSPIHRSTSQVRSNFATLRTLFSFASLTRECRHLPIGTKLGNAVSAMYHNPMLPPSVLDSKFAFANTTLHPALALGQNCCSFQPQDGRMVRHAAVSHKTQNQA